MAPLQRYIQRYTLRRLAPSSTPIGDPDPIGILEGEFIRPPIPGKRFHLCTSEPYEEDTYFTAQAIQDVYTCVPPDAGTKCIPKRFLTHHMLSIVNNMTPGDILFATKNSIYILKKI